MTSFHLKIIACLTMLIDHIGAILFPDVILFRIIGRVAFPIFAFLLVEGYVNTRDVKKYLLRIGIFAVISEIPFDLAFHNQMIYFRHQNVFITLFLGLLSLILYDKYSNDKIKSFFSVFSMCILATVLFSDYFLFGVLTIFYLYIYKGDFKKQMMALIIVQVALSISILAYIQLFAVISGIILYYYNGKRGLNIKYIFYIFYPVHILVLFLINNLILKV